MVYSTAYRDQRQELRITSELPATVSIGSQVTLQGQLKDLSLKSAFIRLKTSIFLQPQDEIVVAIQRSSSSVDDVIQGLARISRIVAGEGLAIYFTKMDDTSLVRLKELLQNGK